MRLTSSTLPGLSTRADLPGNSPRRSSTKGAMSACVGQRVARADDRREAVDQGRVELGQCNVHVES